MAAAEFADRQAQFDAALAEAAAAREALEQQVRIGTAALERAHQDRAADAAAAADTLRERETELGNALGEAVSIRSALEYRLTVLETVRQATEDRASSEAAAAAQRVADSRPLSLEKPTRGRSRAAARRAQKPAMRDAEERHRAELVTAAERLAEREAAFEAGLSAVAMARAALERKLVEAQAALQQVRRPARVGGSRGS